MDLIELIKRHLMLSVFIIAATGFGVGVGFCKAIIEFGNLDLVQEGNYIINETLKKEYIIRTEYNKILQDNKNKDKIIKKLDIEKRHELFGKIELLKKRRSIIKKECEDINNNINAWQEKIADLKPSDKHYNDYISRIERNTKSVKDKEKELELIGNQIQELTSKL